MVAAALSNGVVPCHNVCLNLKDEKVVHADALRARTQFGFLSYWTVRVAGVSLVVCSSHC